MNPSNSSGTSDLRHDVESLLSSMEMAFYGLLEQPEQAKEYEDLFVKSISKIRQIKSLIKVEGSANE